MRLYWTGKIFGRFADSSRDALAALALFVSLGMCGGCLMEPDAKGGSAVSADQGKSLRDAPAAIEVPVTGKSSATGNSGVPVGCSREWSDAAMDSVLSCPDIRPPKSK